MPLISLYFLLAIFQLFLPLGDKLYGKEASGSAQFSTSQKVTWNRVVPEHSFNWIAEVEESDESHNLSFTAFDYSQPVSEAHQAVPFSKKSNRTYKVYHARSGLGEEPLFLMHCNFRV